MRSRWQQLQEKPCEQGYVFTERADRIDRGAAASGKRRRTLGLSSNLLGCAHELKNLTDAYLCNVLSVRVALDADAETQERHVNQFWEKFLGVKTDAMQDVPLLKGTFDAQALTWRDAIHGGCVDRSPPGTCSRPMTFCSDWTFLDHAILDAKRGSVGYHYHDFA